MGLQTIVENELDAAMREYTPAKATLILIRPQTGEILAMANRPNFDLNLRAEAKPEEMKNRAIIDMMEPGSTFKIVTAAAALNEQKVTPNSVIFCENGVWNVGGRPLHDHGHKGYGDLSVQDILVHSSNIGAAKSLVEASGWTMGADGVYERDGTRLSTDVYTRSNDEVRTKFVDLVADQVRDCGIELNVVRADGDAMVNAIYEFPHVMPGATEPFQALVVGLFHGFDPDDPTWSSRRITSGQNPASDNFMGFNDPAVDQLLDQGKATYDQRERARIYRELQQVLAHDQPVLFGWGGRAHEAMDSRLRLTDGPLDLRTGMWWWQLEKLVLPPN